MEAAERLAAYSAGELQYSDSLPHYYRERRTQLQVNAAGALLHDWAKEQYGIQKLVDEGRVVLL